MPETEIKTVNSMFAGRTTEIPWIAIQKKGRRSFALLPETGQNKSTLAGHTTGTPWIAIMID